MKIKPKKTAPIPARMYRGADVPMRVIRRFARQVAKQFQPDKIVLFGSHAYGTPHADSDVDILVIMSCRNQHDQAVKIRMAVPAPFPMDLLVRKPSEIQWRLEEGECFHSEILRRGKSSMEKATREWVRKAEADYLLAAKLDKEQEPFYDHRCFLCQQSSEKYLKALLEERAVPIAKTHDLQGS